MMTHLVHLDVVRVHSFILKANADGLLAALSLESNRVASEQLEFLHFLLRERDD